MDDHKVNQPTMLVLGDSFMSPDPGYPQTHWTEFVTNYCVLNRAQPGASNALIVYNFYQALESDPDVVVVGFTDSGRQTFNTDTTVKYPSPWPYVSCAQDLHLTNDQRLFGLQSKIFLSEKITAINSFALVLTLFFELESRGIPFLYSLNLLKNSWTQIADCEIAKSLRRFSKNQIEQDLTQYPFCKTTPGFPWHHVDDIEWQKRYANEVSEKLKT